MNKRKRLVLNRETVLRLAVGGSGDTQTNMSVCTFVPPKPEPQPDSNYCTIDTYGDSAGCPPPLGSAGC